MESPRLGPLTLLALTALVIMQIALAGTVERRGFAISTQSWLACVWAGWATMLWILVRQPLRLGRTIGLGAALGWHCLLLGAVMERPAERYLITLGGYGLLQSTAVVLLNLPMWYSSTVDGSRPGNRRPQFGILSIVVLTTGVAIVLYASRLYAIGGGGAHFASGSVAVSAVLCLVALTAIVASTVHRRAESDRWWLIGGLGLAALVAVAGAAAYVIAATHPDAEDAATTRAATVSWRVYAYALIEFGAIVYTVGICGRCDQKEVSQGKQAF